MKRLFFKKQRQIEMLINEYLENLKKSKEHFHEALNTCLESGICSDFDFQIKLTHKFESRADDVREEIKTLMYEKVLLPESRGDIMGLLEAMDQVPRLFERILFMLRTQKLTIPDFLLLDVAELLDVSTESCDLMLRQVETLFQRREGIRDLVSTIDLNESHADHIERRILSKIFDSEIDPFQKLQLKDLIVNMGEITDQIDRVSKRVNIIGMKRRV